ncbi:YHYH protein [Flammeovirgaceae bacterium SG7u.111]|nr:YHYH protein [Flammeovirgaceae bacterium SG7u.132]WPO34668.1 YHYH protein [Flammeovirgaceae bacterium SG7u.111]
MKTPLNMHTLLLLLGLFIASCDGNDGEIEEEVLDPSDCDDVATVDLGNRGVCSESLSYTSEVNFSIDGDSRVITSNAIPDHKVGLFGGGQGSLNPNAIGEVEETYRIPLFPSLSGSITPLLSTTSGPQYEFGIMLNGVILDPEAAEPWPHSGSFFNSNVNWEWNLDAMSINLGLDCNNAHVQPTGKYHYHGVPTLYLESINATSNQMTLIGYAADGFPIYYMYGYKEASNSSSGITALNSSFSLKQGDRPGDGDSAPCGEYSGIYTNDYEYVGGDGDLDECNGRTGVTPEYPNGTYYYVITEDFPFLPRCLKGTPSADFKIGR